MCGLLSRAWEALCLLSVVAVCIIASCTPAPAYAATVGLHVGSQHFPAKDFNNVNPGLYIREDQWIVGAYHNSYRKTTAYVAYAYPVAASFELVGGGGTGYRDVSGHALSPIAGLLFRPDFRVMGMRPAFFMVVPIKKASGLVHLALEF